MKSCGKLSNRVEHYFAGRTTTLWIRFHKTNAENVWAPWPKAQDDSWSCVFGWRTENYNPCVSSQAYIARRFVLRFYVSKRNSQKVNGRRASPVACTAFAIISLQYSCPNRCNEWSFVSVRRVEGSCGFSNKIGRALGWRRMALGQGDLGAVGCSKWLLREVIVSLVYLCAQCVCARFYSSWKDLAGLREYWQNGTASFSSFLK